MYTPHEVFTFPPDDLVKIWRYMDFTKFVSLLEKRSLYFPRIDQLEDTFEYAIPVRTQKALEEYLRRGTVNTTVSDLVATKAL